MQDALGGRWVLVVALLVMIPLGALAQESYELTDAGWTETGVADADPGVAAIRRRVAGGEFKDAVEAAEDWLENNPGHPRTDAVLLARADALSGLGRYWKALYDYEKLIIEHPSSEHYLDAVRREFDIANLFIDGWKRKVLGLRVLPTDGEGEELLIRVQERAPGTPVAEQAAIKLADYYFDEQQMVLAAEAYQLFLENYATSPLRERAMLRLIQASLSRFKGPRFDATGLLEAQERLRVYADEYPASAERIGASALQDRITESLGRRDLATAAWYRKRGETLSAEVIWRRVLRDYPGTRAAREAAENLRATGAPLSDGRDSRDDAEAAAP